MVIARYRRAGVPRSDGDLSELIRNPRSISVLVPRIVKWMNQRPVTGGDSSATELSATSAASPPARARRLVTTGIESACFRARAEGEPVIAAPITRNFKSSSSDVQL